MSDSKAHWEAIYKTKSSEEVSWHSPHLVKSFEIIAGLGLSKKAGIIDVGGGASTLLDDLLAAGFKNITVLDVSKEALEVSRKRLEKDAGRIRWLEADVTQAPLEPDTYDCWHDRAVFHFFTKPEDRVEYVKKMAASIKPCGYAVLATFGPNGPLKCSGLEIVRYSDQSLKAQLGERFQLERHFLDIHKTPFGTTQEFLYAVFKKL